MRSNVVSEASLSTRAGQWWNSIPFFTSTLVILCGLIYFICLLVGFDSFEHVCFNPYMLISKFQVYRIYTAAVFHFSILHVVFNMIALVPIGSGLERILGSVRYLNVMLVVATSNGFLHLLVAYIAAHNPIHAYTYLIYECGIGFSGILFAMIVMETSLNGGAQNRSIFGLFRVPGKWYPWILLILFQLLMPNVSLLGHLCGILSGFAYTYGLLNFLLFGSSTYSAIEGSRILASCVERPGFIVGGGMPVSSLPTVSSSNSGIRLGNIWMHLTSWLPQREVSTNERFPGRGRSIGSSGAVRTGRVDFDSDPDLQTRLLYGNTQQEVDLERLSEEDGTAVTDARPINPVQARISSQSSPIYMSQETQDDIDLALKSLVAMGFEQCKAAIALTAANGDLTMAVEILSSQ